MTASASTSPAASAASPAARGLTRLTNVRLVLPDAVRRLDVLFDACGRIVDLPEPGREITTRHATASAANASPVSVIDGGGCFAFPGMLDILTHGYGDYLYVDAIPGAIAANARILARHGVTAFAPSITSKPEAELVPILRALAIDATLGGTSPLGAPGLGARVLGLHCEGPCFASPGAHKPDNLLPPSASLARKMLDAAEGTLRFVTLAPELPGADAFIAVLREAGVSLHLGHSCAPADGVPGYADLGVHAVTHIYDVFTPAVVTEPGRYPLSLADACLAEPRLCLGLICDGVHVLPAHVRLLSHLPADRLFLETDSMKFTGSPAGRFELFKGGFINTYVDGPARDDNGGLAGSTLASDMALRNFIRFTGVDLPRASIAASLNPARLAGVDDRLGSLAVGKQADMVLLDDALQVRRTYVAGSLVYQA